MTEMSWKTMIKLPGLALMGCVLIQGCSYTRLHDEHRELVREVYATQIDTYDSLQDVLLELSQEYGILRDYYVKMGNTAEVEQMAKRHERLKLRYQLVSERLQAMEQRMSAYLRTNNLKADLPNPPVNDVTFSTPPTPEPPQLNAPVQPAAPSRPAENTSAVQPAVPSVGEISINVVKSPAEGIPPQIFVNGRAVQAESLTPMLADMKANNPNLQVAIKADQEAPFALVSKVIDAARAAGITPQLQSE